MLKQTYRSSERCWRLWSASSRVTGVFLVLGENLSEDDLPGLPGLRQSDLGRLGQRSLVGRRTSRAAARRDPGARWPAFSVRPSSLDEALRQVMHQLRSIVPYDNSALFLLQDGAMVCAVAVGINADWWSGSTLGLDIYPLLQEMMATPADHSGSGHAQRPPLDRFHGDDPPGLLDRRAAGG